MPGSQRPPDWLRPRGVAPGTWEYVNERSIASHYDAFVADTPLCDLDQQFVLGHLRSLASPDRPTVLDLGCGTGRHAIPLVELGCDVIAIDLSRHMLDELIAKPRTSDAANLFAIQANLIELDGLRDAAADHAVCMFSTLGMIQGRDNRRQFLSHVRRILRPGGTFVFHVHRRWAALRERGGFKSLLTSWWRSIRTESEFGDSVYSYRGLEKMFMHRFTRHELSADLKTSGWKVDDVQLVSLTGNSVTRSSWNASGFFVTCSHR